MYTTVFENFVSCYQYMETCRQNNPLTMQVLAPFLCLLVSLALRKYTDTLVFHSVLDGMFRLRLLMQDEDQ